MTNVALKNFVWEDVNGDGIFGTYVDPIDGQTKQETGVSGVTVELYKNNVRVGTTTTGTTLTGVPNANNTLYNYSFTFNAGTSASYSTKFSAPSGYLFTQPKQGTDDRFDSDALYLPGNSSAAITAARSIQYVAGGNNTYYDYFDAGVYRPASLSGSVYVDASRDGVRQAGEAGIAGVTITLSGTDGLGNAVNQTTVTADGTTDANGDGLINALDRGFYQFKNLRPGTYTITETTQPAGYADGQETIGSQGGTVTNDRFSTITLLSGRAGQNYNFGELTGQAKLEVTSPLTWVNFNRPDSPVVIRDDIVFIKPEFVNGVGKTFTQTLQVTNTGTAASTPGTIVVTGLNSPFVKLRSVNGQADGAVGDNPNDQIIPLSTILQPGQTITFTVVSQIVAPIVNGVADIPQDRTLSLQLSDSSVFGPDAQVALKIYNTQTGLNKVSGQTAFTYNSLGLSTVTVDVNGGAPETSLSATVARASGTIVEGPNGPNGNGYSHDFFLNQFSGDIDAVVSGRGRIGGSSFDAALDLKWNQNVFVDLATFQNASSTTDAKAALNALITAIDAGVYALPFAPSAGSTLTVTPTGQTTPIVQTATAANFNNLPRSNFAVAQYTTGSLQTFVDALSPQTTYRIELKPVAPPPLVWSDYNPATQAKIAAVQLPNGSTTITLNAANQKDKLDLGQVAFYAVGGIYPVGITILGGNGKDVIIGTPGNDTIDGSNGADSLDGGLGDDTLTGGNGKDTFVFSMRNFGNDVITDFTNGETIDLKALGITAAQIRQTTLTIPNGSTRSLVIDFPSITAGKITLAGISSPLSNSAFILA